MSVIVYTQPTCNPCHKLVRWLENQGIPFVQKDITKDPAAAQELVDHNALGTPFVVTENDSWSGINLDKMKKLVEENNQ